MSSEASSRRLWRFGVLLLLLGLLNGAFIGAFSNPRAALSAHLGAIEGSLVLIVFGFLWPKLELGASCSRIALSSSVAGIYALWVAFLLSAALGTGGSTPLAGAGFSGEPVEEGLVAGLLYLGSAGSLVGVALVLFGLRQVPRLPSS